MPWRPRSSVHFLPFCVRPTILQFCPELFRCGLKNSPPSVKPLETMTGLCMNTLVSQKLVISISVTVSLDFFDSRPVGKFTFVGLHDCQFFSLSQNCIQFQNR